jgi:hypothetical protein
VRGLLDGHGFHQAGSRLTEWHYVPPGVRWWEVALTPFAADQRHDLRRAMNNSRAAAFTAAALLLSQDAGLDMANFYAGDTIFFFGLFDPYGAPLKPYYALLAFSELQSLRHRVPLLGTVPATLIAAATCSIAEGKARVLLVNHDASACPVGLSLPGPATGRLISEDSDLAPIAMAADCLVIPAWSTALVDVDLRQSIS